MDPTSLSRVNGQSSKERRPLNHQYQVFPLYEVINGEEYHISVEPRNLPVEDYLKQQGRFSHLGKEDFEYIQQKVDYEWKVLLQRSMMESFQMVM